MFKGYELSLKTTLRGSLNVVGGGCLTQQGSELILIPFNSFIDNLGEGLEGILVKLSMANFKWIEC